MTDERESLSPTKIGIGVLWPAFWTGFPLKLAFAVVFFAMDLMQFEGRIGLAFITLLASPVTIFALPIISMGLDSHIGEGAGIAFLFLLAIPIDIWALGVVGRTYFLEKFRKEPPDGLSMTLWWKCAAVGAVFLPILWYIIGMVTSTAMSMAHSLLELEAFKSIPVAERISLELALWGSVSAGLLLVLLLIGVSLIGRMIRSMAETARPVAGNYQDLIRRLDLMRVPGDQGLVLTAFIGTSVVLSLLFWNVLPVTTPHPHELYAKEPVKVAPSFKPVEALQKTEKLLAQAEAKVQALETKAQEDAKGQAAGKGKSKEKGKQKGAGKEAPTPRAESAGK